MECYNGLRPIGILLYYAFPSVLATDPVTITYITLLLNLICLGVLLSSSWVLVSRFSGLKWSEPGLTKNGKIIPRVLVAGCWLIMLIQTIGYLPLRLADIQSLALLMAGIAIVSTRDLTPRPMLAVGGGIVAGCSVLFRQNYVIAIALIVLVWVAFSIKMKSKAALTSATLFALGATSCLIQVVWVYLHTGIPWFYEPQAMLVYAESTAQPYVELLAYSLPADSAYASQLARPVSELQFLAVKFFHGLFKFYWTPSLGAAPFEYTPPILDYSNLDLLAFQAIMVVVGLISFASIWFGRPWLTILVMAAFGTAVLTAFMSEVEYRYFLFPRLAYIIYAFTAVWIWLSSRLKLKVAS